MPFNIGPGELILILAIALLLLGPAKLPEVAQSLGKSVREFRKAASDISEAAKLDAPPEAAAGQVAPVASASATPAPPPPVEATTITRQPDATAMAAPIAPAPAAPIGPAAAAPVRAVPLPAELAATPAPVAPESAAPEADRDSSAG